MEIAVFSAKPYDREYLDAANAAHTHRLKYYEVPLDDETGRARGGPRRGMHLRQRPCECGGARSACEGRHEAGRAALHRLQQRGPERPRATLGIKVVRVVDYSPNSVAEHAVALLLAINRKMHRAYNRTRDFNFSLDGLMGFDLYGKTVAVIGTGKIGRVFAKIMLGFGCNVIGYDQFPSPEFEALGARYAEPGEIGASADIISLHCPLTPRHASHHRCRYAFAREARRVADQHEPRRR